MSNEDPISLLISFQDLPDPRVQGRCDHKLIDIIVIAAVCAAIADAETWVDVESFGKTKQEWLSTFLELPNGIPSHDTFGRFFAALDAEAFQTAFMRWVESVYRVSKGEVVAIDGKTLRRSHDRGAGKDAIHMVNAWATRLVNGRPMSSRMKSRLFHRYCVSCRVQGASSPLMPWAHNARLHKRFGTKKRIMCCVSRITKASCIRICRTGLRMPIRSRLKI